MAKSEEPKMRIEIISHATHDPIDEIDLTMAYVRVTMPSGDELKLDESAGGGSLLVTNTGRTRRGAIIVQPIASNTVYIRPADHL